MSHEAREAGFTIASRRCRVRGCRLVIHAPVSATHGANQAAIKRLSHYKAHGLFLDGPRRPPPWTVEALEARLIVR